MAHDSHIELRVSRLEHDRDDLWDLFDRFRQDFDTFRTDMLDFRTDMLEFRTDMLDFKTDMLDFRSETRGRFDRIEETLVEIVRRLPEPS